MPHVLIYDQRNMPLSEDRKDNSDCSFATSSIQCLNHAVENVPERIFIYFHKNCLKIRTELLELCNALKSNRYTKRIPIIVILDEKNRPLIETLSNIGIEYVKFEEECTLQVDRFATCLQTSESDRIKHRLKELCPYLHYKQINASNEMPVCSAYYRILAIGSNRLKRYCENIKYVECNYYKNPKS